MIHFVTLEENVDLQLYFWSDPLSNWFLNSCFFHWVGSLHLTYRNNLFRGAYWRVQLMSLKFGLAKETGLDKCLAPMKVGDSLIKISVVLWFIFCINFDWSWIFSNLFSNVSMLSWFRFIFFRFLLMLICYAVLPSWFFLLFLLHVI